MMGCWLSVVEGTGAWHVAGGSWHEGWCTVADALACPWCMGKELAARGEDCPEMTKCGAKGCVRLCMGAMEAGARRDIYEQVGEAHVFGSSSMQTREWGFLDGLP